MEEVATKEKLQWNKFSSLCMRGRRWRRLKEWEAKFLLSCERESGGERDFLIF